MQNKTFVIGAYGIEKKDILVLERIFKITDGRTRSYKIQNKDDDAKDIAMVNVSNRQAIKQWGSEHLDSNGRCSCPTLLAGKVRPKNNRFRFTSLPFFASRVLKILDEITVEEFNYTPEITIDDVAKNNQLEVQSDRETAGGLNQEQVVSIAEKTSDARGNSKRAVLVVDDSLPVRQALEMKLTMMDFQVQLATSGKQALELIEKNYYDSIFLDVVMPGVDGYEVCKVIKRNKNTKHIPVIMLTSKSSPFDKVKGKLAGCNSYLTKPVEHEEFQNVVSGYLG